MQSKLAGRWFGNQFSPTTARPQRTAPPAVSEATAPRSAATPRVIFAIVARLSPLNVVECQV